jgi:hypothetical protein
MNMDEQQEAKLPQNDVWAWVDSILRSGRNLIDEASDPAWAEKTYEQLARPIHHALSYYNHAVTFVDEMNRQPWLPGRLRYEYLLGSVPRGQKDPGRRRWAKKDKNLQVVAEYFGYGPQKAAEALRTLTDEQVQAIIKEMEERQ